MDACGVFVSERASERAIGRRVVSVSLSCFLLRNLALAILYSSLVARLFSALLVSAAVSQVSIGAG